jgi:hypothetical protein
MAVQLERLSRVFTLLAAAVALAVAVLAPLWALSWSNRPFPGFLVEPSLAVTGPASEDWTGTAAGITPPQRLVRFGGQAMTYAEDLVQALADGEPGDRVPVFTALTGGDLRLYPAVELMSFPFADFLRMFLAAYGIGVAYLLIGLWVYRLRGATRPGRVLAFFCFCAAVTCMLIFDIWTTHAAVQVWTLALALSGGAIVSLAMRFPVEWGPVERRPWLLALPYLVSLGLAGWGVYGLSLGPNPDAYVSAWSASYRYLALAVFLLLGVTLRRALTADSVVSRRQARLMLGGATVAFLPITVWFLAPIFGLALEFEPLVYLPPLLLFPVTIWIAILRYRLLDVDDLLSRTLLYGTLTAILAGVYTITITISQRVFVTVTGEESDAAVVLTTLIVVSAITPLRNRLQALLDRRLKTVGERGAELQRFADQVRLYTQLSQPDRVARRFLDEAVTGLKAESGALSLLEGGRWRVADTRGHWTGEAWLSVTLTDRGERFGVISLGPPLGRRRYTEQERDALGAVAADLGRSLATLRAAHPAMVSH